MREILVRLYNSKVNCQLVIKIGFDCNSCKRNWLEASEIEFDYYNYKQKIKGIKIEFKNYKPKYQKMIEIDIEFCNYKQNYQLMIEIGKGYYNCNQNQ